MDLDAGEALFAEGDAVDAFYFVINGSVEVSTMQEDLDGNPDNDRLVLAEIGPGATIGEMAILVAIGAAHRGDGAFEAARYVIDRTKEIVPVWKKEVWADGEEWIEGDHIPR